MKLPGRGMSWKEFGKALKEQYQRDNVMDAAASLTFFGVLALFPFLLFLVALAGLIIDEQQIQVLVDELAAVAPPDAVSMIETGLTSVMQGASGGLLTLGAVAALWSASSGVAAIIRALNNAYDVEESRPFWKVRLVALGMTLVGAALFLAAALLAIAAPGIANAIGGPVGTAVLWLRLPVAALFMMLLWALFYWALPDVEQKFKFISPGAIVGVIVWVLASLAFSFYVSNFGSYNETYGAIGAVIVLLLWMWITAQALIVGAEINAVLEHRSEEGKQKGAKRQAESGSSEAYARDERRPPPQQRPEDRGERPLH